MQILSNFSPAGDTGSEQACLNCEKLISILANHIACSDLGHERNTTNCSHRSPAVVWKSWQ